MELSRKGPLCIGRRDPITCLGSEGDTDPSLGSGTSSWYERQAADGEGERAWLWESQDGPEVLEMLLAKKLLTEMFIKQG